MRFPTLLHTGGKVFIFHQPADTSQDAESEGDALELVLSLGLSLGLGLGGGGNAATDRLGD
jgi:hypothetical protein